jgi:hypothetical protein
MQETQGFLAMSSPAVPPATLSKKAFGEAIGVSAGRVSQMISMGLPVEPNGRIDPAKGRAWVGEHIDPNRRRAALPDGSPLGFASSRAEREAADAKTARLKAERLEGNLLDRAAALRAIETRARAERDGWIAWVNRVAPEIASATDADLGAVVALLDRLVRDQLASLADMTIEGLDHD